jgi:hypothetical protein
MRSGEEDFVAGNLFQLHEVQGKLGLGIKAPQAQFRQPGIKFFIRLVGRSFGQLGECPPQFHDLLGRLG